MVGRKSCIIAHQIKEETHQRCRKFEIHATVVNDQNMKCDKKGSVNMKLQDVQKVKLTEVFYVL